MPLEYFQADATDQEVVAALERDGACVVLNQARSDIFDYIERFHNPRRRRKMERLEAEKKLFIKPSVETG